MRRTQVVPVESYTVSGLYTESYHGKCVFDGRIEMHFNYTICFIYNKIYFIIIIIIYLFFICNYFRVKETYTNNSKLAPY